MAQSVEYIAEQLFKIIKGFGHTVVLFTDDGKKTVDPSDARRFYAKDLQMMTNLVVDETTNEVVVNLSQGTQIKDIKPMLDSIRTLANRHIMEYTVKTFGKSITPRDFAYQAKNVQESDMGYKLKVKIDWDGSMVDADVIDYTNDMIELKSSSGDEIEVWKDEPDFNDIMRQIQSQNDHDDWREKQYLDRANRQVDRYRSARATNESSEEKRQYDRNQRKLAALAKERNAAKKAGQPWKVTDAKEREYYRIKDQMNETFKKDVNEGFSGWKGSARKSVNELDTARIVVKHKRNVDEEKRGARTRQIESIFIENGEGERFKFPSTNITAAKAMARHVQEGGAPFDDFGQHIYGIMEELSQLKTFNRKNRKNDFFEDAQIGEEITSHIGSLRSNLKQIASPRGYKSYMEGFSSDDHNVSQERIDELKDAATVTYFDESISDSLPYVARVIENLRGRQAREEEIATFARLVMSKKDEIQLNQAIDDSDPENPSTRTFKDPATAFAAWVTYLAPKMKDDDISNKMMSAADSVHQVGRPHLNMAAAALNVIRQKGQVVESDNDSDLDDIESSEMNSITESLAQFDVRKLFGV